MNYIPTPYVPQRYYHGFQGCVDGMTQKYCNKD